MIDIKELCFTEEDVKQSTDKVQLLIWQGDVNILTAKAKSKLDLHKQNYELGLKSEWKDFYRTKGFIKLLEIVNKKIALRLTEIEEQDKKMKTYAEKELVAFGNYLLSDERKETIINQVNLKNVTDADISNFLTLESKAEVEKNDN